jgi:hypothetical protein
MEYDAGRRQVAKEYQTMSNEPECKTITVEDAGRIYFGLSRNGSYDAAKRGDIPTIKVGRLLRVPIAAMERRIAECGQ